MVTLYLIIIQVVYHIENYHVKNNDIYANVVIPSTGSFVFSEWSMCDDHLGEHCDVSGLYVPQIRESQRVTVDAGSICNNPTNNPCFQGSQR